MDPGAPADQTRVLERSAQKKPNNRNLDDYDSVSFIIITKSSSAH